MSISVMSVLSEPVTELNLIVFRLYKQLINTPVDNHKSGYLDFTNRKINMRLF